MDKKLHAIIFMCVFFTIFFSVLLRQCIKVLHIPVPENVFNFIFGVLVGLAFRYLLKESEPLQEMEKMNSFVFFEFYVPLIVFKTAFCVDLHLFQRGLPQVMVITFFVVPFNILYTGFIMKNIIGSNWEHNDAIFFGSMCMAIYPSIMVHHLESTAYFTNQATILLEGETLSALFITMTISDLTALSMKGVVVYWYQFVCLYLRRFFVSICIGLFFSWSGKYLMRLFYNDAALLMLITLSLSFVSNRLEALMGGSLFGVVLTGAVLSRERAFLPNQINEFLTVGWKVVGYVLTAMLVIASGIHITASTFSVVDWSDAVIIFLTYIIDLSGRFIGFLIFSPILSRIGLGMSFTNMMVCVWGGIKNPFNLGASLTVFSIYALRKAEIYFMHLTFLCILSNIINGTFALKGLQLLGIAEPPLASKINLKNCTKYILKTRQSIIASMKTDRFYSCINWSMVETATNMNLPYQKQLLDKDENDEYMYLRFASCSQCETNVPGEPSKKELKEMMRQARRRVLKAQIQIYKQLYQDRAIFSKKVMRTLIHAVEVAIDSPDATFDLDSIYRSFTVENCVVKWMRRRLNFNKQAAVFKRPDNKAGQWCYTLLSSLPFSLFMCFVINADIGVGLMFQLHKKFKSDDKDTRHAVYLLNLSTSVCFFTIYLLEFLIRILAYNGYKLKRCVNTYFRSFFNTLDYVLLNITAMLLVIYYGFSVYGGEKFSSSIKILYSVVFVYLPLTRSIKLVRYFCQALCSIWPSLENANTNNMVFVFSLGKAYIATQREVLDIVPFMIDNQVVQQEILKMIYKQRNMVVDEMLKHLIKKLEIFTSVNTHHAVSKVLKNMTDAINELKVLGFVDHVEHENLMKSITNLYKRANSSTFVPFQTSPVAIFEEIVWLEDGGSRIGKFLFDNVDVRKFDPNEEICNCGEMAEGIYIVVRGVLSIHYAPSEALLKTCHQSGCLPVIDYMPSTNFSQDYQDVIMQGSCLGELATITRRPYDASISSYSYSEVYVLSRNVIMQAMEIDSDPIDGLHCRIWKSVGIKLAVTILKTLPSYSVLRKNKIKFALERSFMPDLSKYKIFVFNPFIKDIILIEGIVVDFYTREIYYGPAYIPRTVEKLILSSNKLLTSHTSVETKLLIIPVQNVDKRIIMEMQNIKQE